MKKLILFLAIVVLWALLPVNTLFAQGERASKTNNLKIAFEFGINAMTGDLVKPEQIRENRSSGYYYFDGYDYGYFVESNSLYTMHFSVKPEYFIFNNRIGIASGIRFTRVSSKLVSDRDIFLWKISEDGLNTGYVRINDISHQSYLIGVPVEIRIFPNNRELPFQHYFKIGASFNYRIFYDNTINFASKTMEKYGDLLHSQLPENNMFSAFLFGAIGFKIGKFREGRMTPWGNLDFQLPYLLLTDNSFAFVGKSNFGVGFQLSLQIPIGKNVPIGSREIDL